MCSRFPCVSKPVQSAELQNVHYPTLDTFDKNMSPVFEVVGHVCNEGSESPSRTRHMPCGTGTTYSWTLQSGFSLGREFAADAGVSTVSE